MLKSVATMGLASLMFGTSVPSLAQEQEDPTVCEFRGMWGDIEGRSPTVMIIRQNQSDFDDEDSVMVAFFNDDWTITRGQKLGRIKVAGLDGGWFDNEAIALERGFLIWSDFDGLTNVFEDYPAGMVVTRNGKIIDKLKLSDMWSDWSKFRACRYKKVAVAEERKRKEKLAREIPKDPFSK